MAKKFLKKSEILNAGKVKYHEFHVPEWDDGEDEAWMRIKCWTIAEADSIAMVLQDLAMSQISDDWSRQICAISIVDENGNLMFGDGPDGPDYEALGKMSPAGMIRVRQEALAFSLPQL